MKPPLTYPLAEAQEEMKRLRLLVAKYVRRLNAAQQALERAEKSNEHFDAGHAERTQEHEW